MTYLQELEDFAKICAENSRFYKNIHADSMMMGLPSELNGLVPLTSSDLELVESDVFHQRDITNLLK